MRATHAPNFPKIVDPFFRSEPGVSWFFENCTMSRHVVQGVPNHNAGMPHWWKYPYTAAHRFTLHLVRALARHLSYNSLQCCYITIPCSRHGKPSVRRSWNLGHFIPSSLFATLLPRRANFFGNGVWRLWRGRPLFNPNVCLGFREFRIRFEMQRKQRYDNICLPIWFSVVRRVIATVLNRRNIVFHLR